MLGVGRSAFVSWITDMSWKSESHLALRSSGAGELRSREAGVALTTGLRAASVSSVAILLASAVTRAMSTGSRWREELLRSPL